MDDRERAEVAEQRATEAEARAALALRQVDEGQAKLLRCTRELRRARETLHRIIDTAHVWLEEVGDHG